MGQLNTTILEKINLILTNKHLSIPESNVELIEAMRYLNYLVSSIQDLNALEKALIRFFRIRPKHFNDISSPISSIYNELSKFEIFPDTPQTSEEKLLSEFVDSLFTKPQVSNDVLLYKTIANVENGIHKLNPYFDWNRVNFLTWNTLLHDAASNKDLALVTLLLTAGANVKAVTRFNISPLDNAIDSRDKDIIMKFITHPGIEFSESDIDKLLSLLVDAIKTGKNKLATTILLIEKSGKKIFINHDGYGDTPLHLAAKHGNEIITKMLIDNRADVNKRNIRSNTPLSLLAVCNEDEQLPEHSDITRMLLQAMSPDAVNARAQDSRTTLDWAFHQKNKDIVKLLLEFKSINLSSTFTNGCNALILAVFNGWEDVVETILSMNEGKKLVNVTDNAGWTPLHYAADYGNKNITKMLIENGANTSARSIAKETPLTLIARRDKAQQWSDHPAIVNLLLDAMTPDSVNASTFNFTALERAVNKKNPWLVLRLVQFEGINLDGLFDGKTIEQVAKAHHWTAVTNALQKKRGTPSQDINRIDALEHQVKELTQTVVDQKAEIEKLNMIIQELRAASNAEPVRIIFRPSVDTSALRAPGSGASPPSSPK
jgi:ankyrin repeat protein